LIILFFLLLSLSLSSIEKNGGEGTHWIVFQNYIALLPSYEKHVGGKETQWIVFQNSIVRLLSSILFNGGEGKGKEAC
jgi:hypothetical protein